MSVTQRLKALLGISAYQMVGDRDELSLDSPSVVAVRESMGGQLSPVPYTQVRWLLKDLESAQIDADAGNLAMAARLWSASKRDGIVSGVLSTRTGGLVRLPRKFRGDPQIVSRLEFGHESVRSVFDEMFPPDALSALADDGIGLGIGVAELVPVQGRDYPVMVRLPPENLVYWWVQNRWYYRSVAGLIPITPGDGHWILHCPGGRIAPWQAGVWRAVGRAFINKEHALLHDQNWQAKLANPARVAVSPEGATDEIAQSWFRKVMAWGVNTVFGMKPGFDVKLLESNGRGHEAFNDTVIRSEREIIIAIAGQEVTTSGGAGFSNANIHSAIRKDLIKATADSLAYTINTQGLPPWVEQRWGEAALETSPCVEWDVTPPSDRSADAAALVSLANAISLLGKALDEQNARTAKYFPNKPPILVDTTELISRFSVPVLGDLNGDGSPDIKRLPSAQKEEIAPLSGKDQSEELNLQDLEKSFDIAKKVGLQPNQQSVKALLETSIGAQFELVAEVHEDAAKIELAPADIAKVIRGSEARASLGQEPFGDERDDKTVAELGMPTPAPLRSEEANAA